MGIIDKIKEWFFGIDVMNLKLYDWWEEERIFKTLQKAINTLGKLQKNPKINFIIVPPPLEYGIIYEHKT